MRSSPVAIHSTKAESSWYRSRCQNVSPINRSFCWSISCFGTLLSSSSNEEQLVYSLSIYIYIKKFNHNCKNKNLLKSVLYYMIIFIRFIKNKLADNYLVSISVHPIWIQIVPMLGEASFVKFELLFFLFICIVVHIDLYKSFHICIYFHSFPHNFHSLSEASLCSLRNLSLFLVWSLLSRPMSYSFFLYILFLPRVNIAASLSSRSAQRYFISEIFTSKPRIVQHFEILCSIKYSCGT